MFRRRRLKRNNHSNRQPSRLHRPSRFVLRLIPTILLTMVLVSPLVHLFKSDILRINSIDCSLDNGQCSSSQTESLYSYNNKISLFLKPSQIAQKMLEQDPSLSDASVELDFPNRIKVKLTSESSVLTLGLVPLPEAEPTISTPTEATSSTESSITPTPNPIISSVELVLTENFQPFTITRLGTVLPQADHSDSPSIFIATNDSTISPEILSSIHNYNQELTLSSIPFIKGWVIENNLIILLKSQSYVIFTLTQNALEAISTLQQIRTADTIKTDRAIIDLRFNKPVISSY